MCGLAFGSPSTVDLLYPSGLSLSLLAYSRQPIEVVALIQELRILLRKGAVETASQSPGFYDSIFLIQKVSG